MVRPLKPARPGRSGALTVFQIKLERVLTRMHVSDLGERIGVPPDTIRSWRTGSSPSLANVQMLARGLDMPVSYFADDTIPPTDSRDATREDGSSRVTEGRAGAAAEKRTDYAGEKKGD